MFKKPGMMVKDGLQVLERVEMSVDEEDGEFLFEELDMDEDEGDEDNELEEALASIQFKQQALGDNSDEHTSAMTQVRPSVVDDFVRNFLIKAGMKRSLDSFNAEWYELKSKGKLPTELSTAVPDIYLRNEDLDSQTRGLREQVEKMRQVATRAQMTWDKFRKERDFHRMHHKRVGQEKNKLLNDIKRLRNHLRSYEPVIDELKRKHEVAMKEKMLISLERDRLRLRIKSLEEQVATTPATTSEIERKSTTPLKSIRSATRTVRKQAIIPVDDPSSNPFLDLDFDPAPVDKFHERKAFRGHINSVSACAFHPKKPIIATASDDETWRLWTLPDCELVMSGEGHKSWLSDINFHPLGSHLATSSGDSTVKIWELAQARCTQTFTDNTLAVWGCEFHYAGDLLATCSMDHTVRVFDLIAGRCRQTLRGHVDSVNAIAWLPYSTTLCSASGDKTLSVWDARSGLCVQTLYGHSNTINSLCVTKRGDTIISCDADGVVKVWDLRKVAELGSVDVCKAPLNSVTVDRSGRRAVAAADDGSIRAIDLGNFCVVADFIGHDDAVQCVTMSPNDSCFVSGGSDSMFKIWGTR